MTKTALMNDPRAIGLVTALTYVRTMIAPDLSCQHLAALVLIGQYGELSVKDLERLLPTTTASASRIVQRLGSGGSGGVGLGLVTSEIDPSYQVRRRVTLSQKGKEILGGILSKMAA